MFLLGNEFSEEQKRRNFGYYDPLTTGDSSLSACVQSIIAAEIGEEHKALEYFQYALLMDLGNVRATPRTECTSPRPPAYGPRSSSGSAASATSTAGCPSRPGCRAPGTELAFSLRFCRRQLRVKLTHDRSATSSRKVSR
jgi:Trehalose and maltose hydrolases (possible phosphorylases)